MKSGMVQGHVGTGFLVVGSGEEDGNFQGCYFRD